MSYYQYLSQIPKFSKAKRIAIDSVFTGFSPKPTSHRGAWPKILRDQILSDDPSLTVEILYGEDRKSWDDYDLIVVDMGMEFKGTALNFVGGVPPDAVSRVRLLEKHRERVVFQKFIASETLRLASQRGILVYHGCKEVPSFNLVAPFSNIAIGDSHVLSAYDGERSVLRFDGKTLYGATKLGDDDRSFLMHELGAYASSLDRQHETPNHATVYFGNIDVRMHFCRSGASWPRPGALARALCLQINQMREWGWIKCATVVGPLPVENESRVIPKSGWFKGKPFHGSWKERVDMRDILNESLRSEAAKSGIEFWEWPDEYENDEGELHFHCMESPRSVHLSQLSYVYDLDRREAMIDMEYAVRI